VNRYASPAPTYAIHPAASDLLIVKVRKASPFRNRPIPSHRKLW
jgi:hypothetical protein